MFAAKMNNTMVAAIASVAAIAWFLRRSHHATLNPTKNATAAIAAGNRSTANARGVRSKK